MRPSLSYPYKMEWLFEVKKTHKNGLHKTLILQQQMRPLPKNMEKMASARLSLFTFHISHFNTSSFLEREVNYKLIVRREELSKA